MYAHLFIAFALALCATGQGVNNNNNAAACWDSRQGPRTEYPQLSAVCPDGTTEKFCGCNIPRSEFNHSLCKGQRPTAISGSTCGLFSCPAHQHIVAVRRSNPSAGVCCPVLQCVNNTRRHHRRELFSPNLAQCYQRRNNRTEYPIYGVTCADGSTHRICGCNVRNHSFPPGVCNSSQPARVRGTPCPMLGCRFGVEVVSESNPTAGVCCPTLRCRSPPAPRPPRRTPPAPVQPSHVFAPTDEACYPTDPLTEFPSASVTCADGTQHTVCGCNSHNYTLPPNVCPNNQFTTWNTQAQCNIVGCAGQLIVVAPANPKTGKCCPEVRCQPVVHTAADPESCWVLADPRSSFVRVAETCADGITREFCACNTGNYSHPPAYTGCPQGEPTTVQTSCGLPQCDGQLIIQDTADPAAGRCCPTYECLGINSDNAMGETGSQLEASNGNAEMPAYAVALVVIGSIVAVLLVVVVASLIVFVRN